MTALGHRPRSERRARAEQLLALVHLSDHQDRRPHELSGGERQRVALARALAREPAVLLLDEPFAAVDRAVRRRLQDEIDELRRTLDIPLILVTHDFEDVVRLATHLLILEHGRAIACGPLSDLMSRPDLPWLRDAVGLGSVFEARVARRRSRRGLVELAFDGGALFAADRALGRGHDRPRADPGARSDPRRDANRTGSVCTTHCPARCRPSTPTRRSITSSCRSRSEASCCWPKSRVTRSSAWASPSARRLYALDQVRLDRGATAPGRTAELSRIESI